MSVRVTLDQTARGAPLAGKERRRRQRDETFTRRAQSDRGPFTDTYRLYGRRTRAERKTSAFPRYAQPDDYYLQQLNDYEEKLNADETKS